MERGVSVTLSLRFPRLHTGQLRVQDESRYPTQGGRWQGPRRIRRRRRRWLHHRPHRPRTRRCCCRRPDQGQEEGPCQEGGRGQQAHRRACRRPRRAAFHHHAARKVWTSVPPRQTSQGLRTHGFQGPPRSRLLRGDARERASFCGRVGCLLPQLLVRCAYLRSPGRGCQRAFPVQVEVCHASPHHLEALRTHRHSCRDAPRVPQVEGSRPQPRLPWGGAVRHLVAHRRGLGGASKARLPCRLLHRLSFWRSCQPPHAVRCSQGERSWSGEGDRQARDGCGTRHGSLRRQALLFGTYRTHASDLHEAIHRQRIRLRRSPVWHTRQDPP
mmetsp:Transcript_73850/g.173406  ORF Transcript_73850/g.173406 Transcript_73850/m.173406 type:complete len:328 (+) Transcript_73850:416-1399(+)